MGLLDFVLGSGDYADPTKMDPNYGVPLADSRTAALNALGNVGAILMAAGQRISPEQRAAYLGQLGQVGPQATNDMLNAAQRRLLQSQMQEKRDEAAAVQRFGQLMQNPDQFRAQTGFDVREFAGMPPREAVSLLRQVQAARLARDPAQAALTAAQLAKTQRELATPETKQVGNVLYERDTATGGWKKVAEGAPQGGLEGEAQALILAATRDPSIAETPEYAIAFNRLYGPKMVTAFNPATQQMEYQFVSPPPPQGAVMPRSAVPQAMPAAPAQGEQPAAPAAAAPGTATPLISQRPPEEKPLTEDQARATGFAKRMVEAAKVVDPLDMTAAAKPGFAESVIGPKIGELGINFMRDEDRQRYRQAQENWVRANLRKESGAVIGEPEMQKEIENYFPRPGDNASVIEQKRKSREAAMTAMITAAGPGAKKAGVEFKPYEPSMADRINAATPQELLLMDTSKMSDQEKAAYFVRINRLNRGR